MTLNLLLLYYNNIVLRHISLMVKHSVSATKK